MASSSLSRRQLLAEFDAGYVTPFSRLGPHGLARISPTVAFYRTVASVILRFAEISRDGQFTRARWGHYSNLVRDAFEAAGAPVLIENLEVFRTCDEPCVILGNHMSTTETFLPAGMFRDLRPITFVVKQALIDYPVFKHIMRASDPVVVGRTDPREDLKTVLTEGTARLESGTSVIVFPQRTRAAVFDPTDFNSIGVKLARRAGVPVVPLAVKTDAWGTGRRLKDFGPFSPDKPVHFAFGEPMPITGNGKAQNDATVAFISQKLAAWETWDATWRAAR